MSRTLVCMPEKAWGAIAWKIPTAPEGWGGQRPVQRIDCPRGLEEHPPLACYRNTTPDGEGEWCLGMCGIGPDYVYCQWGLYEEDAPPPRSGPGEETRRRIDGPRNPAS